jgi:predicted permease
MNHVSEGYFETLGIPLLRGRLLTERDSDGAPKVAVINESAARHFFGQRDPLGESLVFRKNELPNAYQIVGIVRDTKHRSLREPSPRFAYLPIRQPRDLEKRVTLTVASELPEGLVMRPIRSAIAQVDPALMISDVITMRRQIDTTLLTERLLSGLSAVFGTLALALASIGLYGVLSYRVGQQKQAIGIRMALGASPGSVARGVLRQSAAVVTLGLVCGLPFAVLGARAAESLLWGVKPGDAATYAVAAGVLSLAALASAWLPARRAANVDPAEALRQG